MNALQRLMPLFLFMLSYPANACEIVSKTVINQNVLELRIDPSEDHGSSFSLLERLLNNLRALVNVDPVALIERQRTLFENARLDTNTFNVVLNHAQEWIRPSNCVERLLTESHLQRFPSLLQEPSEFGAFVLKRPDESKLKVFLISTSEIFVPILSEVDQALQRDVSEGWKLWFHIHLHPFFFSNQSEDIAGTLIPSGELREGYADLGYFLSLRRKYDAQEFRIINGFNTLSIPSGELDHFALHF